MVKSTTDDEAPGVLGHFPEGHFPEWTFFRIDIFSNAIIQKDYFSERYKSLEWTSPRKAIFLKMSCHSLRAGNFFFECYRVILFP